MYVHNWLGWLPTLSPLALTLTPTFSPNLSPTLSLAFILALASPSHPPSP